MTKKEWRRTGQRAWGRAGSFADWERDGYRWSLPVDLEAAIRADERLRLAQPVEAQAGARGVVEAPEPALDRVRSDFGPYEDCECDFCRVAVAAACVEAAAALRGGQSASPEEAQA